MHITKPTLKYFKEMYPRPADSDYLGLKIFIFIQDPHMVQMCTRILRKTVTDVLRALEDTCLC